MKPFNLTNEPAFPVSTRPLDKEDGVGFGHQDSAITWQYSGMTLRDYFAAKAMQSFLSGDGTYNFEDRARDAYRMADAMLKAREAK